MSIRNDSGDWQEGTTTTPNRATRVVGSLLAVCMLIIIGMVVLLNTGQTNTTRSGLTTPAITVEGVLREVSLPMTPTLVVVFFENATPIPFETTATPPAEITATPVTEVSTAQPEAAYSVVGRVSSFAGGAINIRSGPGLNYSVVAFLQANQQALVLAQSTDGTWWRVDFNGKLGWLRKDTVSFVGDKNAVPIAVFDVPTPTAGAGR